jgi:hypothetical protein
MTTEKEINTLLNDKFEKHINDMNERLSGVFLCGFMVGVIASYSGFLSYLSGIGTGVILVNKYSYFSSQISDKASYIFQNVLNIINVKLKL